MVKKYGEVTQELEVVVKNSDTSHGELPFGKMNPIRQWRLLQNELHQLDQLAQQQQEKLQTDLVEYRLTLVNLDFILADLDERIWEQYHQIYHSLPSLKRNTFKRPLFLRTPSSLKQLYALWIEFIRSQAGLSELIIKAPKEHEFFNHESTIQRMDKARHERIVEGERKLSETRQAIEQVYADAIEELSKGETFAPGAELINREKAEQAWRNRITELDALEKDGAASAEELLQHYDQLHEDIRLTPYFADQVRRAQDQFEHVVSLHDMLVGMGKSIIPQDELARATVLLYEHAPKYWAQGQFVELERCLRGVEKFISFYEETVKFELEGEERRRPGATYSAGSDAVAAGAFAPLLPLIRSLVNAIDARDRFMRGHSESVAKLSLKLARKLNWADSNLELLEVAALLHDVGKLYIPEALLTKPELYTNDERKVIEKHPQYGANIVKPISVLKDVLPWVYHHQERWDGNGYPDQLSKKEIPLSSGIIAVAESFTVMTIDAPYRKAMSKEEALAVLERERGKQFNPEVIDAFLDLE